MIVVIIVLQVGSFAFQFWRLRLSGHALMPSRAASAYAPLLGSKSKMTSFDDVEIISAI
jgi:hypothetical protein